MQNITASTIVAYLIASGLAWVLHESAHYAVHSLYAESVSFGANIRGPYVDAAYDSSAPTWAIRIGSIAPTLLYTPLVIVATAYYLSEHPVPQLDPVGWSFVLVPIAILIVPTGTDLYWCVNADRVGESG